MNTIQPLGYFGMAGSKEFPTTYKIKACPKCYAVLSWYSRTRTTCDNCGTEILMLPYKGPLDYTRHMIRKRLLSWETLLFVVYGLVQVLDWKLRLRKLLLFAFVRGLSWL